MVTNIRINVKSICFGSEDLELIFGDTVIPFYASYIENLSDFGVYEIFPPDEIVEYARAN